ncbi:MAG: hypothetical protein PHN61_10960 [Methanothrix sp.]|nr:hypothetical protein [Methanothrix sp.]
MHRPDQMHGNDSLLVLEDPGKIGDRATQLPAAADLSLFQPNLGIEGMQIIPAGGLFRQRRFGEACRL